MNTGSPLLDTVLTSESLFFLFGVVDVGTVVVVNIVVVFGIALDNKTMGMIVSYVFSCICFVLFLPS